MKNFTIFSRDEDTNFKINLFNNGFKKFKENIQKFYKKYIFERDNNKNSYLLS
jgi:hypothetical protein